MFNMFKSKKKVLVAPSDGEIITLDKVKDEVFSSKMMGDGFAIIPSSNTICSPCNGTVLQVFKTKHAFVIKDEFGLEIIVHVGLDTVSLKGEGFDVKVVDNQKVSAGDELVTVDFELLKLKNLSIVTPVVITNMDNVKIKEVNQGETALNQVALTFEN